MDRRILKPEISISTIQTIIQNILFNLIYIKLISINQWKFLAKSAKYNETEIFITILGKKRTILEILHIFLRDFLILFRL